MDIWDLLYELLTFLLGPLPGALGLLLRKAFYPLLFRKVGRAVIFGRSVVIKNADRIVLGDRVVIDDYVVLDGGLEGLRIGDEVMINRGVVMQAKTGPIRIGSRCDIGAETTITSRGVNIIEDMVSIGVGCTIGGSLIPTQNDNAAQGDRDPNDFVIRGQLRCFESGIRIGAKSVLEENVTVLDGTTIGSECMVAASAVVRGRIANRSVVAPEQRLVVMPRATFTKQRRDAAESCQVKDESPTAQADSPNTTDSETDSRIVALVLQAVAEVNQMLPDGNRLSEDIACPLVQPQGPLDSLGVINLLVALEDHVEAEFGRRPNLTEMGATPEDSSSLSTLGSLAKFVAQRLKK